MENEFLEVGMESEMGYILAKGPEGLDQVLTKILEEKKANRNNSHSHYVLYELGNQKSLIKVDTSVWPFKFWHCDLLGRPMTSAVKETINKFLWEKCGEKERYLKEKGKE